MSGHISVACSRETAETFTMTIRNDTKNLLIGYAEITLVPAGARIEAWHGLNDEALDQQLILRAEKPS